MQSVWQYEFDHFGQFNSGNSPLNSATGWAILKLNESATLEIEDSQKANGIVGIITWQADTCLDKALTVHLRNQYYDGSGRDHGHMLLNGGNPF